MDKNLKYLNDMFLGLIDQEVIRDVFHASNCDINKATEQLSEFLPADSGLGIQNMGRNIALSSTLSATAPEFVPSSFALVQQHKPDYIPNFSAMSKTGNPKDISMFLKNNQESSKAFSNWCLSVNNVPLNGTVQKENDSTKNGIPEETTIMSQKEAVAKVQNYIKNGEKVMILLRGCPGSGKSTFAKQIKFEGVIFSTDDYFLSNGQYQYSASNISEAHEWNQQRAMLALRELMSPVIIDNTNTQVWEMLPYAAMAKSFKYNLEVIEPGVEWRMEADELAKRNTHGVRKDKILRMMERYDSNITGKDLLEMVDKADINENEHSPKDDQPPINDQLKTHLEGLLVLPIEESSQMPDNNICNDPHQLQILQVCFPDIDMDHLTFLYNDCGRDMNSLANNLMEFGYTYNDPLISNKQSLEWSPKNELEVELPLVRVKDHLSTRIKMKQLQDRFPNINRRILGNIFEASGFMLDVTIKTIEDSVDDFTNGMRQPTRITFPLDKSKEYVAVHQGHAVNKKNKAHVLFQEYSDRSRNAKRVMESNCSKSEVDDLREQYQLYLELKAEKMVYDSLKSGSVDLHGLKLKETIDILPLIFSMYHNSPFKKITQLTIITGRGKHSMNGIPILRPAVISYLKEHDYLFSPETPGTLKVNLRSH